MEPIIWIGFLLGKVRDVRQNKGSILKASVDYIKLLRRDRERRSGVEERCRKLEQNHRRALLKIQVSHLAAFNHIKSSFLSVYVSVRRLLVPIHIKL